MYLHYQTPIGTVYNNIMNNKNIYLCSFNGRTTLLLFSNNLVQRKKKKKENNLYS